MGHLDTQYEVQLVDRSEQIESHVCHNEKTALITTCIIEVRRSKGGSIRNNMYDNQNMHKTTEVRTALVDKSKAWS
jgi:hypothetical protein